MSAVNDLAWSPTQPLVKDSSTKVMESLVGKYSRYLAVKGKYRIPFRKVQRLAIKSKPNLIAAFQSIQKLNFCLA